MTDEAPAAGPADSEAAETANAAEQPAEAPGAATASQDTESDEASRDEPTQFAALTAPEPSKRPKIFAREAVRPAARQKTIAAVAIPRTVRSAAQKVGLQLDQTSLIGVIDARSGRQALVRMPGGDYRKVSRGDVLDGWRVNSIGREAMRLTRRGQNRTLLLVSR